MKFTFKIGEKIKEAWPLYKANFVLFLLFIVFCFVAQIISNKNNFILSIIVILLNIIVGYMLIRLLLSIVDKKEFNPFSKKDMPSFNQLAKLVSTYLSFMLIIIIPIFIVIIPTFFLRLNSFVLMAIIAAVLIVFIAYVQTRLIWACFISVDKNQWAVPSLKESWSVTEDNFWSIFWRLIVISLFGFVGFLALGVGAIITYPLAMIVFMMMYREFTKWRIANPVPVEIKREEPKVEVIK